MADAAIPPQQYAAPETVAPSEEQQYIQQTPTWVVVLRGLQVLLGFIIFSLAAYLIHGKSMGPYAFSLVCGLFTWIVVGYVLITEKMPSAHAAYNIWAVLALDFLLALFWMASLGANAALRATFTQTVNVKGCYNDGSSINSNHCIIEKRDTAVAGTTGLAVMSAIAGLSALPWLLFVATLVFHGHTYRLWRQENKKPSTDNAAVEMKAEGTPMLATQGVAGAAHPPQYSDPQQYQSQVYPPQQAQVEAYPPQQQNPEAYPPQQQPDAYAQQIAAYAPQQQQPTSYQQPGVQPYAAYPDPMQAQYSQQQPQPQPEQQQAYSPHGTPAPGQQYYPPQPPPQQ